MHFENLAVAYSAVVLQQALPFSARPLISPNPHSLSTLSKRALNGLSCGRFSTASRSDTWTNINNLNSRGGQVKADAGQCSRLGCYNKSGIYLCNDQDEELTLEMDAVMDIAAGVYHVCIPDTAGSGQAFDATGWSVVIGYCNGNDDPSVAPSGYTPPGPNGEPDATCSGDDCGEITCDESSIIVQSQEVVTCNEYLGPTYTGAGETLNYAVSRTVGTTWTVGGSLSINIGSLSAPVEAAGFSASYAESTTTGSTSGSSGTCGQEGATGEWTCAIDVKPQCYGMTGTCSTQYEDESFQKHHYGTSVWENEVPIINDSDDINVFYQNLCVCKKCEAWADEGAPTETCGLDCTTCNP